MVLDPPEHNYAALFPKVSSFSTALRHVIFLKSVAEVPANRRFSRNGHVGS
jgi:hypothetical protein